MIKFIVALTKTFKIILLAAKKPDIVLMATQITQALIEQIVESKSKSLPQFREIYFSDTDGIRKFAAWVGEYHGTPLDRIGELSMERNKLQELSNKYKETIYDLVFAYANKDKYPHSFETDALKTAYELLENESHKNFVQSVLEQTP